MATFRKAQDGHCYIRRGYPLTIDGAEDMRFATYQVLPRAEQLFDLIGFPDGNDVPKELFYALVVDGDVTNEFLLAHPPTIWSVPSKILNVALIYEAKFSTLLASKQLRGMRYVLEYFRLISQIEDVPQRKLLSWACFLNIAQRIRHYDYERKRSI